jgi:hypothetical protein
LGAVVSRLALISAHGNGDKWPHHTQLILFAPAHKGANILELAILALSVIRCFPTEAVARWRFPSLSDLKEDCQTLRYLDSKVQAEVAAGADYLRATAIIHADNDSIVTPLDLIVDPPASFYEQSHTGVCKPGLMFDSPIDEVIRHL